MSNKALTYIFTHSKTKGSARVLMLAIADMANDDGECYPGRANLAKKVNVTERHLTTLIRDCETLGELRVYQRSHSAEDHRTNKYYIAGLYDEKRASNLRPAKAAKRRKFPLAEQGHEKSASGGVSEGHGKSASSAHEKSASGGVSEGHGKSASTNPLLTTLPSQPKIAAIAAVVKMPAKEFQTAFIAGLGYTDAAYKDGKFLTQVKNLSQLMFDCGLTPDDVPEFIAFCRTQFKGKRLTLALIRDMVLPFEASRTVTLHIVEDVAPVHTPSTIAPDTKVIGDMTAAEFDALTPEERQTQIDLKLANIAGRIVGTEGGKRGRQADRNQLDELNKSA